MRLHIALIVLAGALVYGNSLSGPLLFDDESSILNNTQIRQLSPVSVPLSPPRNTPVAGRPLVNLTFALNYAWGGLDVTGYHVVNVALHVLAALALYGLVRRTLALPRLPAAVRQDAGLVACAAALLWVVHPLNTETVNYLTQRTEGLMSLWYLLTLYAALRAATAPGSTSGATLWTVTAAMACAAGMASKESMVTAPIMVALFDRVFLYDSWRETWEKRRALYLGLMLGWVVLVLLMWSGPRTTVGFDTQVSAWTYFLNQLQLIPRYLGLAVWPQSLVLDYGLPRTLTLRDAWLPGSFLVALGVATLLALWRRPMVGFLGAWVFVTLAPTSSFVPIATEVGAERRMYLPLAAIVVAVVLLVRALVARRGSEQRDTRPSRGLVAVTCVLCLVLGVRTVARTREYQDRRTLAQTIVDRHPNGRARFLLADEMVKVGQHEQAVAQLRLAVSDFPQAHFALATEFLAGGRTSEAVTEAEAFIRLLPGSPVIGPARDLLGQALTLQGRLDPAAEQFTLLTHVTPNDPAPYVRLANIRLRQRRFDEAIGYYQSALAKRPSDPEIFKQLGLALSAAGRRDDAIDAFGRGTELKPNDIALLNFLGRALGAQGRYAEAVVPMQRIAELAPTDRQARENVKVMEQLAAQAGQAPVVVR